MNRFLMLPLLFFVSYALPCGGDIEIDLSEIEILGQGCNTIYQAYFIEEIDDEGMPYLHVMFDFDIKTIRPFTWYRVVFAPLDPLDR